MNKYEMNYKMFLKYEVYIAQLGEKWVKK